MLSRLTPAPAVADPLISAAPRDVVLVFGEVLFDLFDDRRTLGGAPFNVARHLRAFGLYPLLVTRTGTDPERNIVIDAMNRFGLDVRGVQSDPTHPTGRVMVETDVRGHRFSILPNQAYDHINSSLARLTGLSARPGLLYFGTLAQRSAASRRALQSLLRSLDAPRFVDINLRKPWYDAAIVRNSLRNSQLLKVNEEELLELGRLLRYQLTSIDTLAARLIADFGVHQVIVTQGERGATLFDDKGVHCVVTAASVPDLVVDTVGSGDGFSAVFILGYLRQWPLELTMQRADHFARALCQMRGAVPLEDGFYDRWREQWQLGSGGRP